jgi:cyanate permease
MTASPQFYGWRIVWAVAISTTVAYGVLYYSYTVFVKAMEAELHWSRAETAGAFGLSMLVAGLVAPFLGRVLDYRGSREVMAVGSLAASGLLLAWSLVPSLPWLYLVWFFLGITAGATFYDPAFTAIAVWFKQHRTRAMLLVTLVAGLASTIFVPLSTFLLQNLGWRAAVRVLALLMLVCAPLLWLVLRRHPHDIGQTVDGLPETTGHSAIATLATSAVSFWRSPVFWSVALAFALARTAMSVLGPHLVPLLLERGLSASNAAAIPAFVGVLQLLGRMVLTPLLKRLSLLHLTAANFALHGLGVLCLLLATRNMLAAPTVINIASPFLWAFVIFYGTTNGAITLTRAGLVAELFAANIYGRVSGAISLLVSLVGAFMPLVAGLLHERSGNYQSTLWLLVLLLALATVVIFAARPRPSQ